MKAVRIRRYGDRGVLSYEDAPVPEIGADEVLVRTVCSAVNPIDVKVRKGALAAMLPHDLPLTLGWDVAGIVERTGADVTAFAAGDPVYCRPDIMRDGTHAEYVAIRARDLARKPETLSFAGAASIPLAGITAWEALFTTGNLQPGQTVLIHGGAGGVGTLAVQLARWKGARVFATASARNHALVRSLGADEVIDYQTVAFPDAVRDADMVLDTRGGQTLEDSWRTLRPGGILVSIEEPPSEETALQLGVRCAMVMIEANAPVLDNLAVMLDGGLLRPVVGAEFALRDMEKAQALSESGHARGKIVIHVGQL